MSKKTAAEEITSRLKRRGVSSKSLAQYLDKKKASADDLVNLYQDFVSAPDNWYVQKKNADKLEPGKSKTRRVQSRELPVVFADDLAKKVCEKLGLEFKEISRGRGKKGVRDKTVVTLVNNLKISLENEVLDF